MGTNNKRRDNRNKNRKDHGKRNKNINLPICPSCGKNIRNLNLAIANKDDGSPTHFDCIIKQIANEETLSNYEKVCYLGGGSFGIVRQKSGPGSKSFFIRKRIQYEKTDQSFEWRNNVSSQFIPKV
jgi:hypothetical protein